MSRPGNERLQMIAMKSIDSVGRDQRRGDVGVRSGSVLVENSLGLGCTIHTDICDALDWSASRG